MTQKNNKADCAHLMKIPLIVFGTIMLMLGVALLMAPETTLSVTNDPTMGQVGLFRFLGAWMMGAGMACWSTGEKAERQHPILLMSSVGCGLGAGALVFVWTGLEYRGDDWIILVAIVLLSIFGALFWWGQTKIGRELDQENNDIRRYADEYFNRSAAAAGRRTLGRREAT